MKVEHEKLNWLFNHLNEQYNFKFDCCGTKENTRCLRYPRSGKFTDINELNEIAWMNPSQEKPDFMFEHFFKIIKGGIAIYRCDNMNSNIWQDIIIPKGHWVFILNEKQNNDNFIISELKFPTAIIGIGVNLPEGLNGRVLGLSGQLIYPHARFYL